MSRFPPLRRALAAVALSGLAACAPSPRSEPDLSGPALELLYAQTAYAIRKDGGLRTDTTPPDAPLSVDALARNFEEIAFFTEFSRKGSGRLRGTRRIRLIRWTQPVRVGVIFGDSVPAAQRDADLAEIKALLARYRDLTGLDMRYLPSGDVNFIVLVLERAEQRALASAIIDQGNFPAALAQDLWESRPSLLCSASLFGPGEDTGGIAIAVALVKAEHRGLMRTSCFHEEMTQALGLLNDSKSVRPSIFNDDEEFALLTLHDEILLRMLYDPRLRVGMSADEARPMLRQIATDAARASGAVIR
ncbi:DUF2927 domain-containing protein [Rhodobacteraceae bacterium 2CG4]|uniref:DUF2927 domain-containing protein n=1 Tax=Halovulum marinum TaxID=2662447 RepID=A0A6L5YXG2_9RHOB|nr:DUF2927 domain-containing protein [Halovulum marinum]MSU88659.1 DUF2927 domain-containing protein [Halovulum marinum]